MIRTVNLGKIRATINGQTTVELRASDGIALEQNGSILNLSMDEEFKTKLDDINEAASRIIIDEALSDSSTHPVQNKTIKQALDNKQNALSGREGQLVSFDATGTPVAVNVSAVMPVDSQLDETSTHAIQNTTVTNALNAKQNVIPGVFGKTVGFDSEGNARAIEIDELFAVLTFDIREDGNLYLTREFDDSLENYNFSVESDGCLYLSID